MMRELLARVGELCSLWVCVLFLTFLLSGSLAAQGVAQKNSNVIAPKQTQSPYHGGLVSPPLPKAKFILTDTSLAPFDFSQQTKGRVTLLFFGYTHCPDECPLHMANIAASLKQLPANIADQIRVVFVTTDPGRDSAKVLRQWLDHFDKRFIGLTGSETEIAAAQQAAALPAARKAPLGSQDYQVEHASFVIAYTKDNFAHVIYPGGINQQDWLADLPRLVNETWASH
jgi:protein SCO1/2